MRKSTNARRFQSSDVLCSCNTRLHRSWAFCPGCGQPTGVPPYTVRTADLEAYLERYQPILELMNQPSIPDARMDGYLRWAIHAQLPPKAAATVLNRCTAAVAEYSRIALTLKHQDASPSE